MAPKWGHFTRMERLTVVNRVKSGVAEGVSANEEACVVVVDLDEDTHTLLEVPVDRGATAHYAQLAQEAWPLRLASPGRPGRCSPG